MAAEMAQAAPAATAQVEPVDVAELVRRVLVRLLAELAQPVQVAALVAAYLLPAPARAER